MSGAVAVALAVVVVAVVQARAAASRRVGAETATVDDLLGVRRHLVGAEPTELDRAIVREALEHVAADGATIVHRRAGELVVGHASAPGLLRGDRLVGSIVDEVARSGRPRREVVTDDPVLASPGAVTCVPMAGPGPVDAVLVVQRRASWPFAASEEATLSAVVSVAGDVVATARTAHPGADGDGSEPPSGLASRAVFDRELAEAVVDGETRAAITALAVLEIDGGDVDGERIEAVGDRVRASLRPTDRIYRFDDRSIGVVMAETDLATACQVAERVRAALAVAAGGGSVDGASGAATASFGVSSCTGGDPARLVARADDARREAAVAGDRVVARW